jgi:serine/threonine protein kinase
MGEQTNPVKSIFLAALEQYAPEQWPAFLDDACAGDGRVRAEVEKLLRARSAMGSFHEAVQSTFLATLDAGQSEGFDTMIGPYQLVQRLGEGGMGAVWMAQQTEPVNRLVALKIIKPGLDSKQLLARFEVERQALALMDHPNIARVLDAGATPSGRPYFVMELVKGVPLTTYCDAHRLTPRQRLELFIPVCQAVQHAHQKGIIHRDLKPSNVLVAAYDGKPVPKVIDFGLAKATGQHLTEETLLTGFGVVGTLSYMSPEQAELNQLDIDTRSDIYSLGVLLYELLTGTTPLGSKCLKEAGLLKLLRLIREQEPPRPSTRLSTTEELPTVAANRGLEPRKLSGLLRGELDWIVMKALEKDRGRRYETASAFAADVQRYLRDEPVVACPPSASYRLRKFVRRNRGAVLAVSTIVLLLAAGVVGTTTSLIRALAAERQAVSERDKKDEALQLTRQALNTTTGAAVEDWLGRQVRLTDQHREFLKKLLAYHEKFAAAKANDPEGRRSRAEGCFFVGRIRYSLGDFKGAESAYRAALADYQQLADESPRQADFRHNTASTHHNLGVLLRATGRAREAEAAYRAGLALQKQLVADFPRRPDCREALAVSHVSLGILLTDASRAREAAAAYREALSLWRQLAAEFPNQPDYRQGLAFSHNELGIVLRVTGQLEGAKAAYREALKLRKRLVAEFPNRSDFRQGLALVHNNLGALLRTASQPKQAEAAYRAALAIRKELAADFPNRPDYRDDLAQSLLNLGNLLRTSHRMEEAEAAYRDALAIRKRLVADFRDRHEYRHALATCEMSLGMLLRKSGRFREAEPSSRESLALFKKLAAAFPERPDFRQDLARAYQDLGILFHLTARPKESESAYHEALALLKPLAAQFANRPDFRQVLAKSHYSLANVLYSTGRVKEAELAYRTALTLQKRLVGAVPNRPGLRDDLAVTQSHLAILLNQVGRRTEAEEAWRDALAIQKQLVEDFPTVSDYHNALAGMLVNFGASRIGLREFTVAVALFEQARPHHQAALKAGPTDSSYREFYRNNLANLARSYQGLADHARLATTANELAGFGYDPLNDTYDAASYLCRCATLAGKDTHLDAGKRNELARSYADRAWALLKQMAARGDKDPARFPTRPQDRRQFALCYIEVGLALDDTRRPKEAHAVYREALAIQKGLVADCPTVPDYRNDLAATLVNLAVLCNRRREFAAAVSLLEQARPHHQAALKANPGKSVYRRFFRNNLWNLALSYRGLADHARLVTTADELAGFGCDVPNDTYKAACDVGRCVTLANQDARLDDAGRKELVQGYADRALALLRQAVTMGFTNVARMRQDPDLQPLRTREDFLQLLADLEGKTKE